MFYAIAVIAIQVMTLLHVIRTGRTQPWLFVVIFLPLVGSIVYLIAEVLPEFAASRQAKGAAAKVQDRLDPERRLRELIDEAAQIDTPQARTKLAEEYERLERLPDAIATYRQAMTGLFADDPDLQFALTTAVYTLAERGELPWAEARTEWDRLDNQDAKFRAKDRLLLKARLLHAEGATEEAGRVYEELNSGFSSIETRVRYAHFLYTQQRIDDARVLLAAVLADERRAQPHVRQMNAYWFDQARSAMDIVTRA
jgi:hypothetical protein